MRLGKGFTLIELMVVLVLAGLLAAVMGTSFGGVLAINTRRDAMDAVKDVDRMMRLIARRHGKPTLLHVDLSAGHLKWAHSEDKSKMNTLPMSGKLQTTGFAQDNRIEDRGEFTIRFDPSGHSPSYGLRIGGLDVNESSWILFGGLTGSSWQTDNRSEVEQWLEAFRHDN